MPIRTHGKNVWCLKFNKKTKTSYIHKKKIDLCFIIPSLLGQLIFDHIDILCHFISPLCEMSENKKKSWTWSPYPMNHSIYG